MLRSRTDRNVLRSRDKAGRALLWAGSIALVLFGPACVRRAAPETPSDPSRGGGGRKADRRGSAGEEPARAGDRDAGAEAPEPLRLAEPPQAAGTAPGGDVERRPEPALSWTDLAIGSGPAAAKGSEVTVRLHGRVQGGAALSSREELRFVVGGGSVIAGLEEGIVGLKAGGRRRIEIPPLWGYGPREIPQAGIPPGATLIYEVELLSVRR